MSRAAKLTVALAGCLWLAGAACSPSDGAAGITGPTAGPVAEPRAEPAPRRAAMPDDLAMEVEDFTLLDQRGRAHQLSRMGDKKVVVLVSHGIACPILRLSYPRVAELAERYRPAGVEFLFLNAYTADTREELTRECEEFGVEQPVLMDDSQLVSGALGITRTAEAIAIEQSTGRVFYRGRIDDRMDYGAQRPEPNREYLVEALDAFLAGRPVEVPRTEPKGCLILLEGPPVDVGDGEPISYADEVAPILQQRCVTCHRPNGIAPFAMQGYDKIRRWSPMMREVVRTQRMPPWTADPAYGHFANDISLSPEEARTLVRWIEQGAPRGEGPDPLAELEPAVDRGWELGEPDLLITGREHELPATGIVPYLYDRVEIELDEDKWVRAVQLRPGNLKAAHHIFVFLEFPEQYADRQPKYDSGTAGYFAVYTASHSLNLFPEGTGKFLPAGTKALFQLHYVTTGRPETDRPQVGLWFYDQPPAHELKMASAHDPFFRIPPRVLEHRIVAKTMFHTPVLLYSMAPHMHYRGRAMRYVARYPDGSTETLMSVPRYDFNWQDTYELAEPKFLPARTMIEVETIWDNSPWNPVNPDPDRLVPWGLQSEDEMLIAFMTYAETDAPPDEQPGASGAGQ